jgi:exoribonuclease R
MPYYTHFTSPIRRFPDVIVHRLLQASLDQEKASSSSIARADGQTGSGTTDNTLNFALTVSQLQLVCEHCSAKQMASKEAQQRCDRVYLSLYLKKHVQTAQLAIVLSVGLKSFTVFLPSLGADAMLYLDEHTDILSYEMVESNNGMRRLRLKAKALSTSTTAPANNQSRHNICMAMRRREWSPKVERGESDELDIKVFSKLLVSVGCKEKPPIDIQVRLEGPYRE